MADIGTFYFTARDGLAITASSRTIRTRGGGYLMSACTIRGGAAVRGVGAMRAGLLGLVPAQDTGKQPNPKDEAQSFAAVMARMKAAKGEVLKRHQDHLRQRYDLENRPASGVTMTGG